MTSPKRRRDQEGGDPKTMAKKPKPHFRYMHSVVFFCSWHKHSTVGLKGKWLRFVHFSLCLSTRSQAVYPPIPLVSTPPTPTFPLWSPTLRRSVLIPQTRLQTFPVYRRTSAGWPATVSSCLNVCKIAQEIALYLLHILKYVCFLQSVCFYMVRQFPWQPCICCLPLLLSVSHICLSPVHATLKSAFSSLVVERDRLRHTIDMQVPQPAQVIGLKTTYASVSDCLIQNLWFCVITPQLC